MSEVLVDEFARRPPTHHVAIHLDRATGRDELQRGREKTFSKAVERFLKELRRAAPGVEYLRMWEWANGVRHAHLLLRTESNPRAALDAAHDKAGVRYTLGEVRNQIGIAHYIVKHLSDPRERAEMAPPGLRVRLLSPSRGFFGRAIRELWAELRNGRNKNAPGRNSRGSPNGNGNNP